MFYITLKFEKYHENIFLIYNYNNITINNNKS